MDDKHQLGNMVDELQIRLEDVEQYTRMNCVEIQGVPEKKVENVLELVQKIGEAIDF